METEIIRIDFMIGSAAEKGCEKINMRFIWDQYEISMRLI